MHKRSIRRCVTSWVVLLVLGIVLAVALAVGIPLLIILSKQGEYKVASRTTVASDERFSITVEERYPQFQLIGLVEYVVYIEDSQSGSSIPMIVLGRAIQEPPPVPEFVEFINGAARFRTRDGDFVVKLPELVDERTYGLLVGGGDGARSTTSMAPPEN